MAEYSRMGLWLALSPLNSFHHPLSLIQPSFVKIQSRPTATADCGSRRYQKVADMKQAYVRTRDVINQCFTEQRVVLHNRSITKEYRRIAKKDELKAEPNICFRAVWRSFGYALSSGVIPIRRSEDEDVDDEGKTLMERDGCGDEEMGVHRWHLTVVLCSAMRMRSPLDSRCSSYWDGVVYKWYNIMNIRTTLGLQQMKRPWQTDHPESENKTN